MIDNARKRYIFEEMPVLKSIFRCAIPSICSQIILVIYNLADTFFIGLAAKDSFYTSQGLSNALIGGVSICMPIFMLISAIANLFGVGGASLIARSLGKGDKDKAINASRFAFYGSLVFLLIYSLLILATLYPLTNFLSGDIEEVAQYSRIYILITVVAFGIPTGLATLFSHLFRAEGSATHASLGIMIGGLLNVALDPLFMFVFFDIKDAALAAALATGVSNVCGLLYFIFYRLRNKQSLLSVKFGTGMFKDKVPGEVLIIGLPACLMTFCENISYLLLDSIIANVSTDVVVNQAALAGVGASKKINMFAHSVARGMTQGVLPLIGYNKTSGRRIRMKKIVNSSMLITLGFAIICLILNTTLAEPLSMIFLNEKDAIYYSKEYLIVFAIGAPFSAIAYSIISFFQAVGHGKRSLLLALLRKGIIDIPLMFILVSSITYIVGIGAVWATPIADIVCCLVSLILFWTYLKNHARNNK
ncbi:MAG: hypothetical protein MJ214_03315 [Bacilli bacterium]|nr:hypothetical protein [Bacilli bacterium]